MTSSQNFSSCILSPTLVPLGKPLPYYYAVKITHISYLLTNFIIITIVATH